MLVTRTEVVICFLQVHPHIFLVDESYEDAVTLPNVVPCLRVHWVWGSLCV